MGTKFINLVYIGSAITFTYVIVLSLLSDCSGSDITLKNYRRRIFLTADTNAFDLNLLYHAGVSFPEVHMIVNFKETSACRGSRQPYAEVVNGKKKEIPGRPPSLCASEWVKILGFNIHNYSGMKYPSNAYNRRSTTSIGSLGDVYQSMLDTGFVLPRKYKWLHKHLINNPHAVYASAYQHALDLRLWQKHTGSCNSRNAKAYIASLQNNGYNPYDKYYNSKTSGLYHLYDLWVRGEFQRKNDRFYVSRMGVNLR